MIRVTDAAITSLMAVYAPYFVEDFAVMTLANLQGSYPTQMDAIGQIVQTKTRDIFQGTKLTLTEPNTPTRFLCECATFALEHDIADRESRAVYDQLKAMPSQHHDDITQMALTAAELYQSTLDVTVGKVITKDAADVTQLIINDIEARTSQTETGGRVRHFSWGILSDGMWLNKALAQTFDLTKSFRPGAEANVDWARSGMTYAKQYSALVGMDRDEVLEATAAFELMVSNANDAVLSQPLSKDSYSLKELMFTGNALNHTLDQCEQGLKNPKDLVNAVSDLTTYVTSAEHLLGVAQELGETLVPSGVVSRLETIVTSGTLALTAFEALRETRFADTLIMYVDGSENNDPTVDVFVNKDMITSYTNAGGDEEDLVKIGNHLDPRNGVYMRNAGWDLDWTLENRHRIVGEVLANEQTRLEHLRANDANVIRSSVETRLTDITQSYAIACNRDALDKTTMQAIHRIARDVTNPNIAQDYSMSTQITHLLCDVIDDPFVSRTTDLFVKALMSDDEQINQNAKAMAVLGSAIEDAGTFFVRAA